MDNRRWGDQPSPLLWNRRGLISIPGLRRLHAELVIRIIRHRHRTTCAIRSTDASSTITALCLKASIPPSDHRLNIPPTIHGTRPIQTTTGHETATGNSSNIPPRAEQNRLERRTDPFETVRFVSSLVPLIFESGTEL